MSSRTLLGHIFIAQICCSLQGALAWCSRMQYFFDVWASNGSSPTYIFSQETKDSYKDADELFELEQSGIPKITKGVIANKVRCLVPKAPLREEQLKKRSSAK